MPTVKLSNPVLGTIIGTLAAQKSSFISAMAKMSLSSQDTVKGVIGDIDRALDELQAALPDDLTELEEV